MATTDVQRTWLPTTGQWLARHRCPSTRVPGDCLPVADVRRPMALATGRLRSCLPVADVLHPLAMAAWAVACPSQMSIGPRPRRLLARRRCPLTHGPGDWTSQQLLARHRCPLSRGPSSLGGLATAYMSQIEPFDLRTAHH